MFDTEGKNKIFIGAGLVAFSALLWSLDGVFLRPRLYGLEPVLVVFLEHLFGFIILSPFLFIYRKELLKITKKQWLTIFWVALFGGVLGTVFITKALFLTGFIDVSVVILLQKLQPVFAIVLAGVFLRERFPKSFYFYALLALLAGFFVTFKDPFSWEKIITSPKLVVVYALLAAFAWGSATTFGKYSLKNINYGLLAVLRFGLATLLILLPALKFFGNIYQVTSIEWTTLFIIVFTSGATAMFLYYYGLKKISASLATLCELSWPVSAVFIDYFVNGNILSWTQILGALILIFSVLRITYLSRPHSLEGMVMTGLGKGKELGMRTANLDVALAKEIPEGLYTCTVCLAGNNYRGLLYHGFNSLSGKNCLEAHILNFSENIVGQEIKVITDRYLRLPKKFANSKDLMNQITKDLELLEEKN